ncbi:MAG: hypothetical protein CMQ40_09935 [Gammaproteobacteria bacterium]|nr:hypothetical protein [Gammaproteobacteria bacterium]
MIPANVNEISAEWLSEILSSGGTVLEVSEKQIEAIGHGMMSNLYRVNLSYRSGAGPASLVIKLPAENQQNREVAVSFEIYKREVNFYSRLAEKTPMRVPQTLLSECSSSDSFVIVMEDLLSWAPGDQVAGCSIADAKAAIDSLADLHATFWNSVDHDSFDWIPDSFRSIMSRGLYEGVAAGYDNFVDLFSKILSPELAGSKEKFLNGLTGMQEWINQTPRTVIHGDFRLDNLLFRSMDDSSEVACCDWQACLRGKGVHDLAYFLAGSLETEIRRDSEHELIERWVAGLSKRGVEDYGEEEAFLDYRKAIMFLWTYVVNNGGLASASQRDYDWVEKQVQRHADAIMDHRCLDLI